MKEYQKKMAAAWEELMEAYDLLDAIPDDEKDDEDWDADLAVNTAMVEIAQWCGKA